MNIKYEYNRKLYLKSFFEGDAVYFETALPLEGEEIKLLYPIKKIISITDYSLKKHYQEGKDFIVKDGKLIILKDGNIPIMKLDQYYVDEGNQYNILINKDASFYKFDKVKYIAYGEQDFLTKHQIAICYIHEDKWNGYRNAPQREKLVRFLNKLKKKEKITMLFFGDSITVGCNSSGTEYGGNVPPFAESWPVMIHRYLEEKYQIKINYVNTAVGGTNSDWAKETYKENVMKYKPDILFLAFGMNDGGMSKEHHLENIMEIINGCKKDNLNLEVVLISTTIPNIETDWYVFGNQEAYIEAYNTINLPYVAICNMTHIEKDILKRKRFKDISGNNINHPNDFLARVYAQAILDVIGE